jgi:hypothetical protein
LKKLLGLQRFFIGLEGHYIDIVNLKSGLMDRSGRENYYIGGMSMFRSIGLSLLIMCAFALLQGATLFAGITNGSFANGLSDWTYTVYLDDDGQPATYQDVFSDISLGGPYHQHVAVLNEPAEGNVFLWQSFSVESNVSAIQFDMKFIFQGESETDYFNAYFFQTPLVMGNPPVSPFYSIGTDFDVVKLTIVDQQMLPNQDGWRRITLPITPSTGLFTLYFEMTGIDIAEDKATTLIDNVDDVELTTVPEPAAMTLGLIGVAVVGAVRRRMR